MFRTLELVKPQYTHMAFRQQLLSDEETMTYNNKWGGTISFTEDKWKSWYEKWILDKSGNHFYKLLFDTDTKKFVGETAYHYDDEYKAYIADVIVKAEYRGKGYGKEGLKLLIKAAKENGLTYLYDNIAVDNSAIKLFLQLGFVEKWRNEDFIMLEKKL